MRGRSPTVDAIRPTTTTFALHLLLAISSFGNVGLGRVQLHLRWGAMGSDGELARPGDPCVDAAPPHYFFPIPPIRHFTMATSPRTMITSTLLLYTIMYYHITQATNALPRQCRGPPNLRAAGSLHG